MAIQLDWSTVRARLRGLLFWQATAEKVDRPDGEATLQDLSPATIARLQRDIAALPEPCNRLETLRAAASEALHAWHADRTAPNHLVVLTEPVESADKLLRGLLAAPPFGGMTRIAWLQRESLSRESVDIWHCLQSTFALSAEKSRGDRAIAVVPDLSWCFLRCIDGLDAIEALLAAVSRDRSRFWLLGCNRWAWLYLDRVCHSSAYLPVPEPLPAVGDSELRQWLDPVATSLLGPRPTAGDEREGPEASAEIWHSALERRTFAQIAELALGLPVVAAPLWLQSLRQVASEDSDPKGPTYATPDLPALPQLTFADRYLLHSLGLHGSLGLSDLARSLAEPEPDVRAQLRHLQRAGTIVCNDSGRFELAPIYYPRLKRDLSNNNLLIEGEI